MTKGNPLEGFQPVVQQRRVSAGSLLGLLYRRMSELDVLPDQLVRKEQALLNQIDGIQKKLREIGFTGPLETYHDIGAALRNPRIPERDKHYLKPVETIQL